MIQAKNVSEVCDALKTQIQEWAGFDRPPKVTRAETINEVIGQTPWIGIYRQAQNFEARTLGLGTGYRRQNISLALVLQEGSLVSGEVCEAKMEKLISEVVSAICSDESIRGTCLALSADPITVTYSSYRVEANSFFQEAVLQITVVTNVTAS